MKRRDFLAVYAAVLKDAALTVELKNDDYSSQGNDEDDAFNNLNLCEILSKGRITREMGVLVRMCDKLSRAFNVLDDYDPRVENESAEDTLEDMINYAAIVKVMLMDRRINVPEELLESTQSQVSRKAKKSKVPKKRKSNKKAR